MKLKAQFAGLVASLVLAGGAFAQAYPSKPVTLLVPYPPGGVSDVVARKVNVPLQKALNQTVLVDNLGGASGSIAAQKVLNAPSDGTLVFQGSPNELILAPMAISAVKYKAEDFRLVHQIGVSPIAIFARSDLPANNGDELAAYIVKMAKEGKPVTYASVGNGTFYHLLGEQMSKLVGAEMTHVPYKGGGPIVADLMGKQIDIFISPYAAPHIEMAKSGKLKIIGALSPTRQRMLPDVPSVDEGKALKGFHFSIGTGYYVKKDTPEVIAQTLNKALSSVLTDEDLRAGLMAQGGEMSPAMSLDAAAKSYMAEAAQFRAIAKSINLQPQ